MKFHNRNLFYLSVVEVGWGLGFGVAGAQILMPVFLREMGAGAFAIALVPATLALGHTLPQFLTPYYTAHLSVKRGVTVVWHLIPAAAWLPIPLYFFFWRNAPPFEAADIAFFLAVFAASTCTVGFAIPLWLDYASRTMDPLKQGRSMGVLFSVQTLAAAGGSWLASLILGSTAFPRDYAICYFLFAFGMAAGTLAFYGTREETPAAPPPARKPFGEYFRHFFGMLAREPRLRRYLAARACVQVYPALLSFYANHAVETAGATSSDAARMSAVFLLFQTAASYAAGRLGERFGHLRVIAAGKAALFLGMAAVLFATSLWHFYLASALAGIFFAAFVVSHVNWLLGFAAAGEDKTLVLSVPGVVLAPAMLACPLLVAWTVEAFSYEAALWGSMAAVALGLALALGAGRKKSFE